MVKTFIVTLFIDAQEAFNKIQHPFLVLKITLNKIGIGEQFFYISWNI